MKKSMNATNTIQEGEVLLATIHFLIDRNALPYQVSVASGRGIDAEQIKSEVQRMPIFEKISFKPRFVGTGPDVVAVSKEEWWQVECKGVGAGKPQTQRNNFDRALASVVSYYDDAPPEDLLPGASPFLGLALPASPTYLSELRKRVRLPLRRQLNLWVLLYDSSTETIQAISPSDEYRDIA